MREHSGEMQMFYSSIGMAVIKVYAFVNTHLMTHLNACICSMQIMLIMLVFNGKKRANSTIMGIYFVTKYTQPQKNVAFSLSIMKSSPSNHPQCSLPAPYATCWLSAITMVILCSFWRNYTVRQMEVTRTPHFKKNTKKSDIYILPWPIPELFTVGISQPRKKPRKVI